MNPKGPPGVAGSIVLALLAAGAMFCGVGAILSDSVTTPAKFGGDHRVHGTDTVLIGVGGLAIAARILVGRRGGHAGVVVSVALAVIGGLFWLAVV
ncbi:MAG: hypothetical protein RI841_01115 [Halomonas sp.]|uniref:hypothetical protein n=1 Tax=Halomonas sp. TaxID=1486246 RepID=UPI00286FB588|nr:hypothetical protein [Halomonas sp.]MDR9438093.1 hypothetical protein [Halomonas sp.]